jgi:hypothetical protein
MFVSQSSLYIDVIRSVVTAMAPWRAWQMLSASRFASP